MLLPHATSVLGQMCARYKYVINIIIIITRERAKRASAPEPHIFMPQKCDIYVWPIATPSAIIVNTIYIILVV